MAVADPYGLEEFDGIVRQHTRCRVIIHSHVQNQVNLNSEIDCSRDVINCSTSKTIKDGGGASFVLVPRRNYINILFPNDYVNIYFNVGDGRGWIRTFFGFVDRISRTIDVDDDGKSNTKFMVSCTDLTKAFNRTEVYFNPYVSNREDMVGDFAGTANLGGLALLTKGLTMHGSPADIIFSLAHVLLGFGSQYKAPDGYAQRNSTIDANRQKRVEWARSRLSSTVQHALGEAGNLQKLEDQIKAEAESIASKNELTLSGPQSPNKKAKLRQAATKQILDRRNLPASLFTLQEFISAKQAEKQLNVKTVNLLDLIDWRYVEWKAIDGYVSSTTISKQEGPLWSIMNSWSNEMVNELFCDLRPMPKEPSGHSGGRGDPDITPEYDRSDDEIGGKNEGAVRYAPCVVMREYPFSTVHSIEPPPSVLVLNQEIGNLYFGAIFSKGPNVPGRKVVEVPAIHEYVSLTPGQMAYKHLDVVCIDSRDISHEDVGRADHDVVNLVEVYSDISGGTIQGARLMTRDIQPIATPISIVRHGLRVRKYETRFGRFSSPKPSKLDSAATRKVCIRWALLIDHWYQHNIEYLSGTITTRALPELRVGYRLDVVDRKESYYVEGVNHTWQYLQPMSTTITVTRGQRNDPYPVYVLPHRKGFEGVRGEGSRLGEVFMTKDPSATKKSLILGGERELENYCEEESLVDKPDNVRVWCKQEGGFIKASSGGMTNPEMIKDTKKKAEELQEAITGLNEAKRLARPL